MDNLVRIYRWRDFLGRLRLKVRDKLRFNDLNPNLSPSDFFKDDDCMFALRVSPRAFAILQMDCVSKLASHLQHYNKI